MLAAVDRSPAGSGGDLPQLAATIRVGDSVIGRGGTYVIAEIGSNHDQSLDTGRELIVTAARAGADAVKFQLFSADALYPRDTEMWRLFRAVELSPDWLDPLAREAREHGVDFFVSVFDATSLEHAAAARVPALKVASSETTNLRLLAGMARVGVPLLISTGMCDFVDVIEAVDVARREGNLAVALLQCGAVYPLDVSDVNLRVMDSFRSIFGCPVGLSDHTLGIATAIAAAARGADVVEKHVTLSRSGTGPDHSYALEPTDFASMVSGIREAGVALGGSEKRMLRPERELGRRDGLYAQRTIAPGDLITEDDIAVRRPAVGIRARHRSSVIGARVRVRVEKGEPIGWHAIEL